MSSRTPPICVVGAGTMGTGIAQLSASSGHVTYLLDADPQRTAEAIEKNIRVRMKREASKGRMTGEVAAATLSRLHAIASPSELEADEPCGLVIEAIVEDLAAKRTLFAAMENVVTADCVLATNTSSLSITEIGADLRIPERFIGMHFFNPAPVMRLVEIVSGMSTNAATSARVRSIATSWGKTPVDVRAMPGFVVNRIARPFYAEGFRLFEEQAADPATIDAVLRDAGGFPMGPFELSDLVGQDVNETVTRTVWRAQGYDPRFAPSLVQRELVAAGWLGRKSGRGFYTYDLDAERPEPATLRPGPPPNRVVARGELGAIRKLVQRSNVSLDVEDGAGFLEFPSGGLLALTNGELATNVAARLGRPVALLDHAIDYDTTSRVAVAVSDGAPEGLLSEVSGLLSAAGVATSPVDDAPGLIVARTLAMIINGAVDLVSRGGANAQDIDVAMQLGTNYRFGPLTLGDQWGAANVLAVLDNLATLYGDARYRACPLLRRRSLTGGRLASSDNARL